MKENIVQIKSYAFAVRIVNLYKQLCEHNKEYILSKQLLRSGTSIAANIEEAIGGQSEKDFLSKLSIAYKEARETLFWIRLLTDTNYIDKAESESLMHEANELLKIIGSIQKTLRNKNT
jgi:four helix bundle protein